MTAVRKRSFQDNVDFVGEWEEWAISHKPHSDLKTLRCLKLTGVQLPKRLISTFKYRLVQHGLVFLNPCNFDASS